MPQPNNPHSGTFSPGESFDPTPPLVYAETPHVTPLFDTPTDVALESPMIVNAFNDFPLFSPFLEDDDAKFLASTTAHDDPPSPYQPAQDDFPLFASPPPHAGAFDADTSALFPPLSAADQSLGFFDNDDDPPLFPPFAFELNSLPVPRSPPTLDHSNSSASASNSLSTTTTTATAVPPGPPPSVARRSVPAADLIPMDASIAVRPSSRLPSSAMSASSAAAATPASRSHRDKRAASEAKKDLTNEEAIAEKRRLSVIAARRSRQRKQEQKLERERAQARLEEAHATAPETDLLLPASFPDKAGTDSAETLFPKQAEEGVSHSPSGSSSFVADSHSADPPARSRKRKLRDYLCLDTEYPTTTSSASASASTSSFPNKKGGHMAGKADAAESVHLVSPSLPQQQQRLLFLAPLTPEAVEKKLGQGVLATRESIQRGPDSLLDLEGNFAEVFSEHTVEDALHDRSSSTSLSWRNEYSATMSTDASTDNRPMHSTRYHELKDVMNIWNAAGGFSPLRPLSEFLMEITGALETMSRNQRVRTEVVDRLTATVRTLDANHKSIAPFFFDRAERLKRTLQTQIGRRSKFRRVMEGSGDNNEVVAFQNVLSNAFSVFLIDVDLATETTTEENLDDRLWDTIPRARRAEYSLETAPARIGRNPGLHGGVMEELFTWATDRSNRTVFWLNGDAGTGRTSVAYSFCEKLDELGLLGASIFCSDSPQGEARDARRIVPTIAYDLARHLPDASSAALLKSLREDPHVRDKGMDWQFSKLVVAPTAVIPRAYRSSFGLIVVLDALDEWGGGKNQDDVDTLLSLVLLHATDLPIKFFVTNRRAPEYIKDGFAQTKVTTFRLGSRESAEGRLISSASSMVRSPSGGDGGVAESANVKSIDLPLSPRQPVLPSKPAQSTMSRSKKLTFSSPSSHPRLDSPQSLPSSPSPQADYVAQSVPGSANGNFTSKVLLARDAFDHVSRQWKKIVRLLRRGGVFEEDFRVMVGFLEDAVVPTEAIFLYCKRRMSLDDTQPLCEVLSPFPYTITRVPSHSHHANGGGGGGGGGVAVQTGDVDMEVSDDSSMGSSNNIAGNGDQNGYTMGNGEEDASTVTQGRRPNGDGSDIHWDSKKLINGRKADDIPSALGDGGEPPGGESEVAMRNGWFVSEVHCYRVRETGWLRFQSHGAPSERARCQILTTRVKLDLNTEGSYVSPAISCLGVSFHHEAGHGPHFSLDNFQITMDPGKGRFFPFRPSPGVSPVSEDKGRKIMRSNEYSSKFQASAKPLFELGYKRTDQAEIIDRDIEYSHHATLSSNPISINWTYIVKDERYQRLGLYLERGSGPGKDILPSVTFGPLSKAGAPAKSVSVSVACFYDAKYPHEFFSFGRQNVCWKNFIHRVDIKLRTSYDVDEPVVLDPLDLPTSSSPDSWRFERSLDGGGSDPQGLSVTASVSRQATPYSTKMFSENRTQGNGVLAHAFND